ncbi:cytochrome P450 94A1-like [Olea europaea var. sylvestris]|uniref:cytochrome P450 94A1-like n=1 Tax=Olea europaea var. sylvestris TaxID=158386 RepID=UPI000C1D6A9E|nr:cytochrome P450 94A1-like [Olea europaea var. sylvestris]
MVDLNTVSLFFLFLTLTFLSLAYFIFRCYSGPPNKNSCPQSYPLVGNLVGFLLNHHRFHDWVADMLSTTPSLTIQVNGFLGLSHGICTANPANLDHLLRSNFSNYVKGTRFQSILHDLLGYGIFNVDGDLWFTQRKIASHEFNTRSLKTFISDTVQYQLSNSLIPYLSTACNNRHVIDLQEVLRRFTFDNICNVAFGVDPAWLDMKRVGETSLVSSFVQAFDYAVEVSFNRFMLPLPAIWKIKRLLNIGSEKRYKEAIEIINEYAMNIIRFKEENCRNDDKQEKNQDLLSRFNHSASNLGFLDQDQKRRFLRDIVISFILAGKDSTSTALTWFFWLIAGHARCERLIYEELSAASSEARLASFSYDDLKKFNYLHAALSESLRLFPPVPINSRLTISDNILSSGTYVGKGWFADYSAYAMGRMKRLWGPDCMEFRPERWLDDDGVFQPRDQFKFPVFHCGPRMCLGKDMAYVQMKSIAAAVMYEFEVVAIDGGGCPERIVNPPYVLSLILKMKGGLPIRLKRR